MSGTSRRCKQFEAMSAPVIALLLDRRLLDSWPFELTKRGWAMARGAPAENVWGRSLRGDDAAIDFLGPVAQMGERHDGIVEAAGSIPAGSTNSQPGE